MTKKQNAFDKATGRAMYTVDLKLPGMLHARILRSPHAHARVVRVDASRAERMSGVKAILTGKDVLQEPHGILPPPQPQDLYTLPPIGGKVRYVGDPVAAVAAESFDTAEEALDLIDVEYEELPAVFDPEEAMRPEAPEIHPGGNFAVAPTLVEFGSVEEGFREADYIFEDTYRTSIQCHVCAEPHSSIASWDADGKLNVLAGTMGHFRTQHSLSLALRIPLDRISVAVPPGGMGGSFGSKAEVQSLNLDIAALLAKKAGRPVKLVFTREEEFACTETRHATVVWLKTGVKKDGTLTARHSKAIYDTGAYATHGPLVFTRALRSLALWKCPNVKWEGSLVYTNKPVAGAFRGFGNPQHTFAVEQHNDEITEELGIDPVEWRLKNHIRVGDSNKEAGMWAPGKPPGGSNWIPALYKIESCGLSECITKGAERIGWRERRKGPGEVGNVKKRGIGVACGMHASGARPIPWFSSAYVKLNEDGTINLITGGVDHGGTGQHTVMAGICAEALGVRPEDITVTAEDTEVTPYDVGTAGASGGTYTVGRTVLEAVADLKPKLLNCAAIMMRERVENLEVKGGRVHVKGDLAKAVSFADIAKWARLTSRPYTDIQGESLYCQPPTDAPSFIANFAEVEVDIETGQVKVLKMVAGHDSGRAMNRMFFEGQVQGGLQQGIGYALTEGLVLDKTTGLPLNPRLLDYNVLGAVDMPEVEVVIVEAIEPTGPFGAKGLGEPCLVCTAPAVANAIYNATGVRIRELPITPEKILKALGEKRKEAQVGSS
jgi:xanthine dehydrogenase molybdenum-binding subunit